MSIKAQVQIQVRILSSLTRVHMSVNTTTFGPSDLLLQII